MKIGKLHQGKIWLAFSILLLSALLISPAFSACAKPAVFSTETVEPESVGLSSEKLNEIDTVLEADIAAKKIPGAVLLIARNGKVAYFKNFGYRDDERTLPMEKDSIFRIYSMTKSITAVAVAMLKDDGKLSFDDPVAKYIPAFEDVQVGEVTKDEEGNNVVTRVPPSNVMTIQHLATHTSGLSGLLGPKPGITELYRQAGLLDTSKLTNAEICDKLAKLPLAENPGTAYRYGSSYSVLGRVIEVVSGTTLDKFFEERIYEPLGMKDSGFRVTGENVNRLVNLNPPWPPFTDATDPSIKNLSASGGTVSTAADYARFAQMLLNGGEFEGKRLLKPETLSHITSDLIGPLGNRSDALYIPGEGYGVGFDFYVRVNTEGVDFPANVGEFCKDGIAGTVYWVDSKENLIAVFMINSNAMRLYYKGLIQKMIYQAIVE